MPLAIVTPSPSETKTSYEYSYDEDGNWIKQVESVWVSSDEPHSAPPWRRIVRSGTTTEAAAAPPGVARKLQEPIG